MNSWQLTDMTNGFGLNIENSESIEREQIKVKGSQVC